MAVCFYASEVAAVIGEHKYQTQDEAFIKIWKRNHPNSYQEALQEIQQQEKEQRIQSIIHSSGVDQEISRAVGLTDTNATLKTIQKKVVEHVCRAGLPQKIIQETMKQVQSNINKRKGVMNEGAGLERFEKKHRTVVSKRNDTLYRFYGKNYVLVGKIDGVEEDLGYLIEHKHRMNRIFSFIPMYERIQIMAYMKLTGVPKAKCVQYYKDDTKTHELLWNDDTWERINSKLEQCAMRLDKYLHDKEAQHALLRKYN